MPEFTNVINLRDIVNMGFIKVSINFIGTFFYLCGILHNSVKIIAYKNFNFYINNI